MIVYFSGTGNSRHVAQELAALTSDKATRLLDVNDIDCRVLGVVCPVYSWGVAPLIIKHIKSWNITCKPTYVWVVLTCGDDTGKAPEMISATLRLKGLQPDAVWSVQMPNTYVLLPGFDVDSPKLEQQKLDRLPAQLENIASLINNKTRGVMDVVRGTIPRLKTGVVYPLFVRFGIRPGKFHINEDCVGCGRCAELCPVSNITMRRPDDGRRVPVWSDNCTSCLACYHGCPQSAIAYGKVTGNKGHFRHWQ